MKSVSYYTLLIAVFLYLVNKAQTELMTEWIWNKGCHNQQPEDVTPAQIASGPGPCFHLCGNTTNYIALQGNTCRCLGELRLTPGSSQIACLTCDGDEDLLCGHEAKNFWSYYERGSEPAALSGHVDNSSDSVCVAVQYHQGGLTQSVEACSKRLHVICSGFQPECEGLYDKSWTWRDAGKVCGEILGSQVDSVDLLNKCNRNTHYLVNNALYWIGLRRISYHVYLTTESSSLSLSPTPTLSSSSLPTSIWLESTSSIPLTSSSSSISTSSTPLSTSIFSPTTSSLSASASSLPLVSKSSLILLSPSSSLTFSSSFSSSLSSLLSSSSLSSPSSPLTLSPTPTLQATSSLSSSLSSSLISSTMTLSESVSTSSIIQTSSSYPSLSNSSSVTTTQISPKASPTAENIQPNKSVQTTTSSKVIIAMTPAANRTLAINIPTTPLRLLPTEGPGKTNSTLNKTQPFHDAMTTTVNAFSTSTRSNTTTKASTTTTPEAEIITSPKRSQTSGLTTTRLGRSNSTHEISKLFTTTQKSTKQSTTPIRRETTTHTLDNPLAMHQMMTADKELKTYYAAFGASTIALLVLIAMFLYLINRSIRKLSYRYLYNKEKYRKQHYGVEERQGNGLRDGATYTENIRRTRRPVTSVDNVRYTTGVNNYGYTWDTRSYGDGYHDDDDIDVNAIYNEEHPIGFRSATRFNGRHDPSALHTGYTSSGRLPSDHL